MPTRAGRVVAEIADRRDELISLAADLIGFDTTAREPGEPAREEAALQDHLATRLRRSGAEVDVWEPVGAELAGGRQVPDDIDFKGRPQLVARFAGAESGPSLLFNGHIDAVSVEPRDRWASDPLRAEVRDGRLYGRGAADMKGGVAAMVVASEALADLGIRLNGDLLVNTVTDEEWNGAGGLAAVAHGVRADAGLTPEATGFEAWVACRGILNPTITVQGRAGHAEAPQPHWREGGAVNAIDKAETILAAARRLNEDWRQRPELQHALLEPGSLVATVIAGGDWWVTFPATCQITFDITYLLAQAATDGYGSSVCREIEDWIQAAAREDDWLAEHPPTFTWSTDLPPAEVADDHLIATTAMDAATAVGRSTSVGALHSWHDPATFTRSGTPTISFGPSGAHLHGTDEYVIVDDLVACAQAYALSALRFTGGE
jgi:acetylornithine deacetylase